MWVACTQVEQRWRDAHWMELQGRQGCGLTACLAGIRSSGMAVKPRPRALPGAARLLSTESQAGGVACHGLALQDGVRDRQGDFGRGL